MANRRLPKVDVPPPPQSKKARKEVVTNKPTMNERYRKLHDIYFDYDIIGVQPYSGKDGTPYLRLEIHTYKDLENTKISRDNVIELIDELAGSFEMIPSDNISEVIFRLI